MVFNFKIGFTQWTSRHVGKNLPKQIWGRKDRGLAPDVRAPIKFFWMTVLYLQHTIEAKPPCLPGGVHRSEPPLGL